MTKTIDDLYRVRNDQDDPTTDALNVTHNAALDAVKREFNSLPKGQFSLGDRVRKKGTKGQWHGRVVGFYSATCTPMGYAVESEREEGSVQIYPETALEPYDG